MSVQHGDAPSPVVGDATAAGATAPESGRDRRRRHARRVGLYGAAALFISVAMLAILLSTANARVVRLDWIVGSSSISLIWVVVGAAVCGWLLGIATGVLFRFRTRRPRPH